jgi:hypothetical protein
MFVWDSLFFFIQPDSFFYTEKNVLYAADIKVRDHQILHHSVKYYLRTLETLRLSL